MNGLLLLAALLLAAGSLAPARLRLAAGRLAGARARRRAEQAAAQALPDVARRLASEVGAGRPLPRALRAAAVDAPAPLGGALGATAEQLASGGRPWAPLERALPGHGGCRLLAASLELQGRAGGDLPRLLRALARALDDRAQVEAELRALTAQARFSATVVPLLPLGALALLALVERHGVRLLLTTTGGLAVVAVAVVLDVIGLVAIRRLVVDDP